MVKHQFPVKCSNRWFAEIAELCSHLITWTNFTYIVCATSRRLKQASCFIKPAIQCMSVALSCFIPLTHLKSSKWFLTQGVVQVIIHSLQESKGNLSLCLAKHHAMKTYWGSGNIAPRMLSFGTGWRWVVSFTPRALYPRGKSPAYSFNRRVSGSHSRYGNLPQNWRWIPNSIKRLMDTTSSLCTHFMYFLEKMNENWHCHRRI
jgi:hypothetical protein